MTRLNKNTCYRCTGYTWACENVNTEGSWLAFRIANILCDLQTGEAFHGWSSCLILRPSNCNYKVQTGLRCSSCKTISRQHCPGNCVLVMKTMGALLMMFSSKVWNFLVIKPCRQQIGLTGQMLIRLLTHFFVQTSLVDLLSSSNLTIESDLCLFWIAKTPTQLTLNHVHYLNVPVRRTNDLRTEGLQVSQESTLDVFLIKR